MRQNYKKEQQKWQFWVNLKYFFLLQFFKMVASAEIKDYNTVWCGFH